MGVGYGEPCCGIAGDCGCIAGNGDFLDRIHNFRAAGVLRKTGNCSFPAVAYVQADGIVIRAVCIELDFYVKWAQAVLIICVIPYLPDSNLGFLRGMCVGYVVAVGTVYGCVIGNSFFLDSINDFLAVLVLIKPCKAISPVAT